ncbi:MAG: hypothetical protein HYW88_00330 [Candidatus Sungbacteria bacterium]|nr:hypothetical protein [Candidatus Sungbacteria bacterium]
MKKAQKAKTHKHFGCRSTSDLALLYVAIDTSSIWTKEDGFPVTLGVFANDPEKDLLQLSKKIETELKKRGVQCKNLR